MKIEPYLQELGPNPPPHPKKWTNSQMRTDTLSTTNTILIKLTMIMYYKIFVQIGPHLGE